MWAAWLVAAGIGSFSHHPQLPHGVTRPRVRGAAMGSQAQAQLARQTHAHEHEHGHGLEVHGLKVGELEHAEAPRVRMTDDNPYAGAVGTQEEGDALYTRGWGVSKVLRYTRRSLLIWYCVAQLLIRVVRQRKRFAGKPESKELVEARRVIARKLCATLIMLGPTFIKIGQLLSTRVDVLPREVIAELSSLQNNVPGFPARRAFAIIEKELGKPVDQIFSKFEPQPLAAASLAQVHRATLKSGEEVVVKVQRENLRELFDIDLFNIRLVAMLADRLDQQTEATSANWKGIADTSGEVLYREIDFNNERLACEEFGGNFESSPDIKVPGTKPELSTSRVLTMEYCPGVKITDTEALEAKGYDPVALSERLTTSYLEQICRHGFFHCDPHPGNLAVDDGHPGGRLVYYDFGMMERVEPDVKKGFVDLVFSIYENLPREACDALEKMGVLRPGIDRFSIERIATDFLSVFQSTLASADNKWENEMTPEQKKASRRARRQRLGADLFATQAERPFLFPPKFTFVFRAFSTIDGIGKGLNPGKYDLSRISQPFLRELVDLRDGSAIKTALLVLGERLGLRPVDVGQVVTQPRRVSKMADTVQRLEAGDLKLRVRAMELERILERVELRQKMVGAGIGSAVLVHMSRSMGGVAQTALMVAAIRLGWMCKTAWNALELLEMQRLRFSNQGDDKFDGEDVYGGEVELRNTDGDAGAPAAA